MTHKFDENAVAKYLNIPLEERNKELEYNDIPVKYMTVKEITVKEARAYISYFHYAKTMPDSTKHVFAGYFNERLAGIICYGMGCGMNQYTAIIPNIQKGQYLELTRLWSPDGMPKNTESKLIGESMKLLPKEVKLLVSFSDSQQSHVGTIYQATNWYYLGMNNGGKMIADSEGKKAHSRLLGMYKQRHPDTYGKMTNTELMKELGYHYVEGGKKHRYAFLLGDKREKRELFKFIKDRILPYPKQIQP